MGPCALRERFPAKGTAAGVAGITGAIDFALGGTHGCWATSTALYCWGEANLGQLGNGGGAEVVAPTFAAPAIAPTGPLAADTARCEHLFRDDVNALDRSEATSSVAV